MNDIIKFLTEEIKQCESGVDDTGEPLFDASAVHLHVNEARKILALIKNQEKIIETYKKADGFLYAHGWRWENVK